LESATDESMVVGWSAPINTGGSKITGYKLFITALNDGDWSLVYDGSG